MSRRVLTTLFACMTGNLLAAEQAATPERGLTIVYAFGGLVLILVLAVALVAFTFAKAFNQMIANEKDSASSASKNADAGKSPTVQIASTLMKRIKLASLSVLITMMLTTTMIVFINARPDQFRPPVTSTLINKDSKLQFTLSSDAAVIEKGRQVFMGTCSTCHRADGGGNTIGPNLTDEYWLHGGQPDSVLNTINMGFAQKGMPAWGKALKPEDVSAVANYVLSLQGTRPKDAKEPQGERYSSLGE